MSSVRISVWWTLVAVLLGASACTDSTGPGLLSVSYDLVSYEGQALPAETRVLISIPTGGGPGFSCSDRLTAMNLSFKANGRFTQTESRLLVCDNGSPDAPSVDVTDGIYEVSGNSLVFSVDLGQGLSLRSTAQFNNRDVTVYKREVLLNGTMMTVTTAPLVFVATS